MTILPLEKYNAVHKDKDGWYFWDETWADRYGPYKTEEECRQKLDNYCKTYLSEKE